MQGQFVPDAMRAHFVRFDQPGLDLDPVLRPNANVGAIQVEQQWQGEIRFSCLFCHNSIS